MVIYTYSYSETGNQCIEEITGYIDYVTTGSYDFYSLVDGKFLLIEESEQKDYLYFNFPQKASSGPPPPYPHSDYKYIDISSIPWELILVKCQTSLPSPKPEPKRKPDPPPPPPPEDDCCRMGCCPKPTEINYKLIKELTIQALKEQKFSIDVPVTKCVFNEKYQLWEAEVENITLEFWSTSKDQALQLARLHAENANQAVDLCLARNVDNNQPVIGVPETWVIKPGSNISQVVISFAEKTTQNGKIKPVGYRTLTIPHPNSVALNLKALKLEKQIRGKYFAEATLKDNSKLRIYLNSEKAAITYLKNVISKYVSPAWWPSSRITDFIKTGIRPGIKEVTVYPIKADLYSNGISSTPDEQYRF